MIRRQRVAAHSLYEKSDPTRIFGPGGHVDLSEVRFEPVDERTVRVSGSRFVPSERYQIKIEGARRVGFAPNAVGGAGGGGGEEACGAPMTASDVDVYGTNSNPTPGFGCRRGTGSGGGCPQ